MKVWLRFKREGLALLCLGWILLMLVLGATASVIAPHNPVTPNLTAKLAECSWNYPLGTDHLGRCILSRLLYGIRTTVLLSLVIMMVTMVIGTVLGVLAGFLGGLVDELLMRLCDVMLAFPSEVMILAIVGIMGPGLVNMTIANIVAKWAWYTRMIRGMVMQYRAKNFIHFAKIAGCGTGYIMRRHLLPGVGSEIFVLATLDTGWVILNISALSFLGLGVQAPTAEWGVMLSEAKNVMTTHPQQLLGPGLAILLTVAAFNFLGDNLRDALDPKYTGRKERTNESIGSGKAYSA